MDLSLADRRFLVTGGSRGLGAAVAGVLTGEGARVAIAARSAVPIAVDLATPDGPAAAVQSAVETLGGLDGLVVNSGGPAPGTFDEVDDATWERAIAGTLMSSIRLIRAALPHLREGRDPAILVILSSSVREPIPGLVTSNVLRPGLDGLVKTLAAEIVPIRINGIAPGRLATDRIKQLDADRARRNGTTIEEAAQATLAKIPMGRYGDPAELGRAAAFLLSPAASYITGVVLGVDGGMIRSLP